MEISALRFFGFRNLNDVARITLEEFDKYAKAYKLRRLDEEYLISLQAFKNQEIQSTKGSGKNTKPVYPSFKSFFDYEKQERMILGVPEKKKEDNKKLLSIVTKLNS